MKRICITNRKKIVNLTLFLFKRWCNLLNFIHFMRIESVPFPRCIYQDQRVRICIIPRRKVRGCCSGVQYTAIETSTDEEVETQYLQRLSYDARYESCCGPGLWEIRCCSLRTLETLPSERFSSNGQQAHLRSTKLNRITEEFLNVQGSRRLLSAISHCLELIRSVVKW